MTLKYPDGYINSIVLGDCREKLKALQDQSVQCVVTSPPYWGLRDYQTTGQLGLESTLEEYVSNLVEVFREIKRVLRDDGTVWLNLGDTYYGGKMPKHSILKKKSICGIPWRVAFALQADGWLLRQDIIWSKTNPMPESVTDRCTKAHEYIFLLTKSPEYYYDQESIREPLKESSLARLAQNVEDQVGSKRAHAGAKTNGAMKAVSKHKNLKEKGQSKQSMHVKRANGEGEPVLNLSGANKKSVWVISTQAFKEAHFATFPEKLVEPCVMAGSPLNACSICGTPYKRILDKQPATMNVRVRDAKTGTLNNKSGHGERWVATTEEIDGYGTEFAGKNRTLGFAPSCEHENSIGRSVILDPFGGSGTVGLVAEKLGRNWICIELNKEYKQIGDKRTAQVSLL